MAVRLYPVSFTVPALTAQNAPVTQAVTLEDNTLDVVRLIIPSGHNGLTGLAILWGGAPWFPFTPGSFISSNNEIIDHPWNDEITANGLSLAGFNTDVYPHTFLLRFQISDLRQLSPVTIESAQATGAPALSAAQAVQNLSGVLQLPDATIAAPAPPDALLGVSL